MISIVCPFFNEQDVVELFFASLVPLMESLGEEFEIVCVNDGSSDRTLELLVSAHQRDGRIRVIDLSRNFGKEAALTAGLDHAKGDAVVPIDADLQDPPQVIREFVRLWREGYEVVLGKRLDRSADSWLKRVTAAGFYRIHNRIADVAIPEDVGDFRLMDRRVIDALRALPERRRFMKGLFAWVGFRTAVVRLCARAQSGGQKQVQRLEALELRDRGRYRFQHRPAADMDLPGLGRGGDGFRVRGISSSSGRSHSESMSPAMHHWSRSCC